jgi:hypothetical protein
MIPQRQEANGGTSDEVHNGAPAIDNFTGLMIKKFIKHAAAGHNAG